MEQPAFGLRLRSLRLERGLSQAALADGGLSTGYLSRLESGARPPTKRVVEHLAARLGVPASAFESDRPRARSLAQVLAAATSAAGDDDLAQVLADALHADDRLDPALRWQALWLLSQMHDDQRRHEEGRALLTELVALSDELDSPELRVRARIRLSRCERILGDNIAARRHAGEARELSTGLSVSDRAAALQALVSAEAEAGRLTEAGAHADELCELTEHAAGTLPMEGLWVSATVRIRQGDHAGAQRMLERALRELDSRKDLMLWMRLRLAAASLYLQIAPPLTERARGVLDEVSPVLHLIGSDLHLQQMLTLRAHLAFEEGRVADARAMCEQIDEQDLLLSFRDRIRFQALRGRLLIADGQVEAGTLALQELAQQAQDGRAVELAAEIWRGLAKALADAYGRGSADRRQETVPL